MKRLCKTINRIIRKPEKSNESWAPRNWSLDCQWSPLHWPLINTNRSHAWPIAWPREGSGNPSNANSRWTNQRKTRRESQSSVTIYYLATFVPRLPDECEPLRRLSDKDADQSVWETPPRCIGWCQATSGRLSCLTLLRFEPTCHHSVRQ